MCESYSHMLKMILTIYKQHNMYIIYNDNFYFKLMLFFYNLVFNTLRKKNSIFYLHVVFILLECVRVWTIRINLINNKNVLH